VEEGWGPALGVELCSAPWRAVCGRRREKEGRGGGRKKKKREKEKKEKKRESCRRDSRRRSATRALRGFGGKQHTRKTGKGNREMGWGLVRVLEWRIAGKDFGTSGVWTKKDLERFELNDGKDFKIYF